MEDRLGRKIEYLRVSVTQNCNLKCIYCAPAAEEPEVSRKAAANGKIQNRSCTHTLSPQDFETIIRSMAKLGIKKIRITGGEPLVRPDVCEIIGRISHIPGIEDISMTTNGVCLDQKIQELKLAGLKRINISLDSLKPEKFSYITGGGKLEHVLKGIEKALAVGLQPVKINTVLIKGVNDDEIEDFMRLAKDQPLEVRFIELMPVGRFGEQNSDKIVYHTDILRTYPELVPCKNHDRGQPARYYQIEGYQGRIGFISPVSHKFCSSCNRIRLTCDGKIKSCLGDNGEMDVMSVLRNNPGELDEFIRKVIFEKPEGHNFESGFSSSRDMGMIGG